MGAELQALVRHHFPEVLNKLNQRGGLARAQAGSTEVADQADADGDFVQGFAGEVPALDLSAPAVADLDLAIAGIRAVADDEMVGHAVFHAALLRMEVVKDFGVPAAGAAVMDDDILPVAQPVLRRLDLGANRLDKPPIGCGRLFGGRSRRFGRSRGGGRHPLGGSRRGCTDPQKIPRSDRIGA